MNLAVAPVPSADPVPPDVPANTDRVPTGVVGGGGVVIGGVVDPPSVPPLPPPPHAANIKQNKEVPRKRAPVLARRGMVI
jgi:hypothetical protein